jgi:PAS domain S-box-containing protein
MATSPDFLRPATKATRALADTALDQLRDAVLVVDACDSQMPLVLANEAARRCLAGENATRQLIETPLASVLGATCAAQIEATLESLSAAGVPSGRTMAWRFHRGEQSVMTEIQLLASATGQRLVMLTFSPPVSQAHWAAAVDGWLKLSMKMAHMQAWRWDQARNSIEIAALDDPHEQSPSEISDMETLLARVHPKDRVAVQRAIDQGMSGEPEVRVEFELLGGDGRYRSYATTARPMLDGTTPRGLVGVIQDVTARRESERRWRRSKELLSATTNNTSDMLCLLDTTLRVRFINKNLNGLTKAQIIGRDIGPLLPEAVRAAALEKLVHILETGEEATFEFESIDDEGARYFENRAVVVRNGGITTGVSISMRDITERKRLEQEILDVCGRERQSIGRDLHDGLGQELTGVALMLRGLASRVQHDCPEVAENINEIIVHVNQSIDAARALARGTLPVRTENGGLTCALRALADRSQDLHGLEVTFRSDVCPEFTLSETNASHLYRIAQEALTNAARHGRATVVDICLAATATGFSLRISDNGEGIVHAAQPSTGMGLKIMKYRADTIGAKFEIEPNKPHGAVITVAG